MTFESVELRSKVIIMDGVDGERFIRRRKSWI